MEENYKKLYEEYLVLKKETQLSCNTKKIGEPCNIQHIDVNKLMRSVEISKILIDHVEELKLTPPEIHELSLDAGIDK